jgi:hypothetical protein
MSRCPGGALEVIALAEEDDGAGLEIAVKSLNYCKSKARYIIGRVCTPKRF